MTGVHDIDLDQRCAHCDGYLTILADSEGFVMRPTVVQHIDAELEADHRVTRLTLGG